jgi:hypothetical protein
MSPSLGVRPKMRYASSFINASEPFRRNAMTPFLMLLTMWRKKRSSAVGAGRTLIRRSARIAGTGETDEVAGRFGRASDRWVMPDITGNT